MISFDTVQVDLTPIYTRINDINLHVLDLSESVTSMKNAVSSLSNQISNVKMDKFDFINSENITGIETGLNGSQLTTNFKFNCINCENVVSNFNSLTDATGSVYGKGLNFDNCFNSLSGSCNFVLSPDKMENCFNDNAKLKAVVDAYELNNCLNNNSFYDEFNFNAKTLNSCLNNVCITSVVGKQYYLKADCLSSCLNNLVPYSDGATVLHIDANNNYHLMENCSVGRLNAFLNGDSALSCFNSMSLNDVLTNSGIGTYLNRMFFLNYQQLVRDFNNFTAFGDCNFMGNVLDMYDCFNSANIGNHTSHTTEVIHPYYNYINGNSVRDCFNSITINNENYFNNSFNRLSDAFNGFLCSDYSFNASLNVQDAVKCYNSWMNGNFNIKLNALNMSNCFNNMNATAFYSNTIGGYVGTLNSCFANNQLGKLNLILNGDSCFNVINNNTDDYYKSLSVSMNYNIFSSCFNGLWNSDNMQNCYFDISANEITKCFNGVYPSKASLRFNARSVGQCFTDFHMTNLYCDGFSFSNCFNSNAKIQKCNMNVESMVECFSNLTTRAWTMTDFTGKFSYVNKCFRYGYITNCNLSADIISAAFISVNGSNAIINANKLENVFESLCVYNGEVQILGCSSMKFCVDENYIANFELGYNNTVNVSGCIRNNSFTKCRLMSPMVLAYSALNSNSFDTLLYIDQPPTLAASGQYAPFKDNAFKQGCTVDVPNVFWIGRPSVSLYSVGIKPDGSSLSTVWDTLNSSSYSWYCSNYLNALAALYNNTNYNLVIRHLADI